MKKIIFTCFITIAIGPHILAQSATIDTIAEKMLLLQRSNGGWSKTFMGKAVNYQRTFGDEETELARKERDKDDTTIDNKATTREITYLLEAYRKTSNSHYKDAASRGVDYLLEAQYPNGGWPQFYPDNRLYRSQITYNDDAIANVLQVLDGIAHGKGDFIALTGIYGRPAEKALQKGIQCILATQVIIDGRKTIWAAQYDKDTLTPATARAYELPSLATSESASILMFLMTLEYPSKEVRQAVRHGVAWFTVHLIAGYTTTIVDASNEPTKKDRLLVEAPGEHVWARFYDLDEQLPLFAGRDGHPHRRMDEIENERRVGYAWYGGWGDKVIRQYEKWKKKSAGD